MSLVTDDENKVFGITFRTPPTDSTGIAHILEHSVLCGSRKYPVKEPFVELLKGSLQTFLNAFTYPDKTCYPVASQNLQDFYNLIDVYLDAVFYPRLTPFIFQQEGWHFELEDLENPLSYKGVVFNEMKGAYSSPDNILGRYSLQSIFPDNTYGFDSGGDPKKIPDLTFEQFKAFHGKYYHPSNGRIFFYGDDDPEERLRLANEYLKDFDLIEPNSTIYIQPSFDRPRHSSRSFMAGQEEDAKTKGMLTLNWLLSETSGVQTNFALSILGYILLGMPASPLRKALIDSELGEDIAGEGLGTELRQIYFSTGLKGIQVENADRIENLILDTLTKLTRKGIDPHTVEAALNTVEFRLRENNSGHFPRGLILMLSCLTTWLYDGDPLALIAFEAPLNAIKSGLKSNSSFFEDMIVHFLLKNPHRTTLLLKPDTHLQEKEELSEKDQLARTRASMAKDKLNGIIKDTLQLKKLQKAADTPEALGTIPVLEISALDKKIKKIPLSCLKRKGARVLFHDIFTNGIAYLDLGFNLHLLPAKYLPYVPLFGRSIVEMGTEKKDFVELTQLIGRKTGGIRPQSFTSAVKDSKQGAAWLFLRGKAMLDHMEDLTHILSEALLTVRLDNRERFRQMVMEEKARCEQKLIQEGHQVINLRLRAHFGEEHWAAEQMGGISYLFFLRKLVSAVDENWPEVLHDLEDIHRILLNRKEMIVNISMNEKDWSRHMPYVDDLIDELPETPELPVACADWSLESSPLFEGITIPSHINYVGKGANLYKLGYSFHGSALVIARYLRNSWLWDRVRVEGGAYGAFCLLDRLSGVLTFVSYRDPNLMKTLEVFDRTAEFLLNEELNEKELTKSIIGTIGDMDSPLFPDAKGYTSMLRFLSGSTEETLQQVRDEVLGTKKTDFRNFAQALEKLKQDGLVKVLGAPKAIEAAAAGRPGWLEVLKAL